ncbi:MAG: NAD(+)/NADH kinase [Thermoleophilia bacterium]
MVTRIAVISHRQPDATHAALIQVLELCRELSIEALVPSREVKKHALGDPGDLATVVPSLDDARVDLCIALGGDGTILRAFNRFPEMQTPVLGINFGRVGFLSAIGPEGVPDRLRSILQGQFDTIDLSLIEMTNGGATSLALNDVVVHKPDGGSVVRLSYAVAGVEFPSLACDGMVLATPAGSTAYNLSNGGPLMSLALETMALTAISPHSLMFRTLVIGPGDKVEIGNKTRAAAAKIYLDGRDGGELATGASVEISLAPQKAHLVQPPGADFYRTLRDRFIHPSG